MQKCRKCNILKLESDFSFKNKKKGLLHKQCKDCTRILVRNHYNRNREYYLDKAHKRNDKLKIEVIKYLQDYLQKNPCVDCGEKDIAVLEFDHNGNIPKFKAVSFLIRNRYSLEIVKREIAKCEVRCANCHRRKTAKDFGWLKIIN